MSLPTNGMIRWVVSGGESDVMALSSLQWWEEETS